MRTLLINALAALLLSASPNSSPAQQPTEGSARVTQVDLVRAAQENDLVFRLEMLEEFLERPISDDLRPVVFRLLVATCREMRDLEAATFYGEEALRAYPGDVPVLLELAAAYAEDEDSDAERGVRYAEQGMQALDLAAKAMGEDGEGRVSVFVGSLLANWGWLEYRRGHLSTAEGMLAEASDRQKSAEIYFRLGSVRAKAGKTDQAKDDFAMALALSSGRNREALEALQEIFEAEGGEAADVDKIVKEKREEISTKKKVAMLEESKVKPEAAPPFTVSMLDGGSVSLESMRGSVVVLDFWATWCGPCRRELPIIQQAYEEFDGRKVEILAISVDSDTSVVRPYVDRNKLTLPVAFGREVGRAYGAASIPMLVVIDGRGQLRYLHQGYHPDLEGVLREEIEGLLEEL